MKTKEYHWWSKKWQADRKKAKKQCPNCGHPRPEPNSAAAFQVMEYIKALEKEVKRLRRKVNK